MSEELEFKYRVQAIIEDVLEAADVDATVTVMLATTPDGEPFEGEPGYDSVRDAQ